MEDKRDRVFSETNRGSGKLIDIFGLLFREYSHWPLFSRKGDTSMRRGKVRSLGNLGLFILPFLLFYQQVYAQELNTFEGFCGTPKLHSVAVWVSKSLPCRTPTFVELRAAGKLTPAGKVIPEEVGERRSFWVITHHPLV